MKKMSLERTNIPLYVQLEQIIRSKIMRGELLPGEQIPTEKDLAETYQVSSITARQAVLNLVQAGLLLRKQGKGTFVQDIIADVKNIMTLSAKGDVSAVLPEGVERQKVEVLGVGLENCPKRVAKALGLEDGQQVMAIRRRRSDGDVILCYVKNYIPTDIGKKISREDLLSKTIIEILRRRVGVPLKTGIQYIEAMVADYEIATCLSVSISSPVLYVENIMFAEGGKPVDFSQSFYRSDKCKYTLKLDIDEKDTE